MASMTLSYAEIKRLQMEKPDIQIFVAGEPVTLASACLECKGTGAPVWWIEAGGNPEYPDAPTCSACNGLGYVVSDTGRDLLRFIGTFGSAK